MEGFNRKNPSKDRAYRKDMKIRRYTMGSRCNMEYRCNRGYRLGVLGLRQGHILDNLDAPT